MIGIEYISLLEKHRETELKLAEALESTAQKTVNPIVKLLITSLVLDSKKHAGILEAMIDSLKGRIVIDLEKAQLEDALKIHVETEKNMQLEALKLMEKTDNMLIKSGLKRIAEDEERHHKILGSLLKTFSTENLQGDIWLKPLEEWVTGC